MDKDIKDYKEMDKALDDSDEAFEETLEEEYIIDEYDQPHGDGDKDLYYDADDYEDAYDESLEETLEDEYISAYTAYIAGTMRRAEKVARRSKKPRRGANGEEGRSFRRAPEKEMRAHARHTKMMERSPLLQEKYESRAAIYGPVMDSKEIIAKADTASKGAVQSSLKGSAQGTEEQENTDVKAEKLTHPGRGVQAEKPAARPARQQGSRKKGA